MAKKLDLGTMLGQYLPVVMEALALPTQQERESALLALAPDAARIINELRNESRRRSAAEFVAATQLAGPAVETCESEADAIQVARRAVMLARCILLESERQVA